MFRLQVVSAAPSGPKKLVNADFKNPNEILSIFF